MINPEKAKEIIDSVTKDEVEENIEKRSFTVNKYYTNIYIENKEIGNKRVRVDNIKKTMQDKLGEFKEKFNETIILNPEELVRFDSADNLKIYFTNTASGTAAVSAAIPYSGLVLPEDNTVMLYQPSQKINTINFLDREDKSININIGEGYKPIEGGFWQSVLGKIVITIIGGIVIWFITRFITWLLD